MFIRENLGTDTGQSGQAFSMFTYKTDDSKETVLTDNYFNDVYNSFRAGDYVFVSGLEGTYYIKCSSINSGTKTISFEEDSLLSSAFNYIDFLTNLDNPDYKEGRLFYDSSLKTLSHYTDIENIGPLTINRELVSRGTNITGNVITKGTVCIAGPLALDNIGALHISAIPEKANTIKNAQSLYGLAMHDIPDGESGIFAITSSISGVDTSAWENGDLLYWSCSDIGELTNVKPKAPDYAIRVGGVISKDAVNGVIVVAISTYDNSDTGVNLEGALNGICTQKQKVEFVVDGGVVYADVSNLNNPTENLPFIIDGKRYLLNTTTGSGVGGSSRIALVSAPINEVQQNYIYIENPSSPALNVSSTEPTGDVVILGRAQLKTLAETDADGVLSWQRYNNSVEESSGDGIIRALMDKIRSLGASYISGVDPTITITTNPLAVDSIKLETTSGIVSQARKDVFDALDGTSYYIVNHPTEPFKKISNLNEIDIDANGDSLFLNGIRYGLNIIYGQNSNGDGGASDRAYVLLPNGSYNSDIGCINDINNFANTSMPNNFSDNSFRTFRLCFGYTNADNGTITNIIGVNSYQDERGFSLGGGGGGGGSSSIVNFSDGVFTWFNSVDPTKVVKVDVSGVSTGTIRNLIFPDKDGTIALLSDVKLPKGYINGGVISNNVGVPLKTIDITDCLARSSDDTQDLIVSSGSLNIDTAGDWASGSVPTLTNASIFVWADYNSGTQRFILDDATGSNIAGAKRRTGAFITDASGDIIGFTSFELTGGAVRYKYKNHILDLSTTTISTGSRTAQALSVPPNTKAEINTRFIHNPTSNLIITEEGENDSAPTDGNYTHRCVSNQPSIIVSNYNVNNNSQIYYRGDIASLTGIFTIQTLGYKENR